MATTVHNPLKTYSQQLLLQFKKAKTTKNPALYLYTHNARTPLFMAQSVTRILVNLNASPNFESWHKAFKKVEDALGEIDFYDVTIKSFIKNKLIKKNQIDYLIKKKNKAIDKLNKKLIEKEFYLSVFNQIILANELNLNNTLIINEIKKHIAKEVNYISEFFSQFPKSFNNMELQVHELRRKLRWLSIYAQSLNGIIVLKKVTTKYEWEKQFITASEKTSIYNNLNVVKNLNNYIYFNHKVFYALSFIIKKLGNIKDLGLNIYLIEKSIRKTHIQKINNVEEMAIKQLQLNTTESDLLNDAHKILTLFVKKYSIPQQLILK